jgi:hypothetical protein
VVKRSGRGVDHPPQIAVRLKKRVQLYLSLLSLGTFMADYRVKFILFKVSVKRSVDELRTAGFIYFEGIYGSPWKGREMEIWSHSSSSGPRFKPGTC